MNKVLEDLKKLKNVYYDTEKVNLGKELEVVLQPLTSEEEAEVHVYSTRYDQGLAYLYSVKKETLCKSIVSLNGNKIPEFIEDKNAEGAVEKVERCVWIRSNIVKGWNQIMIDQLWQGYANLIVRLESKLGITSTEEVQEKETEK